MHYLPFTNHAKEQKKRVYEYKYIIQDILVLHCQVTIKMCNTEAHTNTYKANK